MADAVTIATHALISFLDHSSVALGSVSGDFGLIDPTYTPATGDAVTISLDNGPSVGGTIVQARLSELGLKANGHFRVDCRYTQTAWAASIGAPTTGFSDVPSGTRAAYRNLAITKTLNSDGTTTTTGYLECASTTDLGTAGVTAGTGFLLTSAALGISSVTYFCTNLVQRLNEAHKAYYEISFGVAVGDIPLTGQSIGLGIGTAFPPLRPTNARHSRTDL